MAATLRISLSVYVCTYVQVLHEAERRWYQWGTTGISSHILVDYI
jgi:hypothetical protein